MKTGVKITGNRASEDVLGSDVYVGNSGIFTMTGGEISGNWTSHGGGGVYVSGGAFTETGGTLSNIVSENNIVQTGKGHAVYSYIISGDVTYYRDTTVTADQNMSKNGSAYDGARTG